MVIPTEVNYDKVQGGYLVPSRFSYFLFAPWIFALILGGCSGRDGVERKTPLLTWGRSGIFVTCNPRPAGLRGRLGKESVNAGFSRVTGTNFFASLEWLPQITYELFLTVADGKEYVYQGITPLKPAPVPLRMIDLEARLPFLGGQEVTHEPTFVSFSPEGTYLALGTSEGYVAVFETISGETTWRDHISQGYSKQAAFSHDGSILYVGEQSPDGYIYAFSMNDLRGDGKIIWKYRLADDLGTSAPVDAGDVHSWIGFPGPYRILALHDGDLLVLASHSWEDESGGHARSLLYRFDGTTGSVRWKWPSDGPCPLTTMWFDTSSDGGIIALLAHERYGGTVDSLGRFVPGSIYLVDGETGEDLAEYTISPLEPYFKKVVFWRSVALRPGGGAMCVTSSDGRGFLFDLEGISSGVLRLLTVLDLATPFESGGIPVVAAVGTIAASRDAAIFATGVSYIPMQLRGAAEEPLSLHPQANTLFVFDWRGRKRWQLRLTAPNQGIALSGDGRFIALPISSGTMFSAQSRDGDSGVVLLDATRDGSGDDKYLYTYLVEGTIPYAAIDISRDGRWVAVAETPLVEPDRGIKKGKTRVHLFH